MTKKTKITLAGICAIAAILGIEKYRRNAKSIKTNGHTATITNRDGSVEIIPLEDDRSESNAKKLKKSIAEIKEGIEELRSSQGQ